MFMYVNCQHFIHSVQKPMVDSKEVTGVATQTPFWLCTFNKYDFFYLSFWAGEEKVRILVTIHPFENFLDPPSNVNLFSCEIGVKRFNVNFT